MKVVQYEKRATWKECNTKKVYIGDNKTWKEYNTEKMQQDQSTLTDWNFEKVSKSRSLTDRYTLFILFPGLKIW